MRNRSRWRMVAVLTVIGLAFGLLYTLLRIFSGIMPWSWAELENAARTGAFTAFCLGLFFQFYVYADAGAALRRLNFITGWIVNDLFATIIIAGAMLTQRIVFALLQGNWEVFTGYVSGEIVIDILIAFLVFLVIALFLQLRPLLGEGVMWKVLSGRYHRPRRERRIYMFLDLRGSTAAAERMGDAQAHALISEVFFITDRLIADYGGEVLSYNGDEIVATWLEADGLRQGRCLACYGEILSTLAQRRDDFNQRYGLSPAFWAGLHMGPVVVGECGDSKRTFLHIGDTPNTAARLQQMAKEKSTDCLISADLLHSIQLPEDFVAEAAGNVVLRGHGHETEIFRLRWLG